MGNLDKKKMQQMMDKMGMEQQDVPADTVIIRKGNEEIVFEDPSVAKVDMMGEETWQVTGTAKARTIDQSVDIDEEDIETVMDQTGASEEKAKQAIEDNDGDLTDAIMALTS